MPNFVIYLQGLFIKSLTLKVLLIIFYSVSNTLRKNINIINNIKGLLVLSYYIIINMAQIIFVAIKLTENINKFIILIILIILLIIKNNWKNFL